eukprot:gb/GECH01007977.1/.p1 GENE.gb/GECH01007977.1/~~gb/GECH01007977.1/.p1  ORF type:complete len:658 (+),score=201.89 gb/GECH01007977.1/:1-1974(+)
MSNTKSTTDEDFFLTNEFSETDSLVPPDEMADDGFEVVHNQEDEKNQKNSPSITNGALRSESKQGFSGIEWGSHLDVLSKSKRPSSARRPTSGIQRSNGARSRPVSGTQTARTSGSNGSANKAKQSSLSPKSKYQQKKIPKSFNKDQEAMYIEIEQLKKAKANLEKENTKLKAKVNRADTTISRKERQVNELLKAQSITESGSRYESLYHEANLSNNLKSRIRDLENQLEKTTEELERVKSESRFSRIKEMEIEIKTYYSEALRLQDTVSEMKTSFSESNSGKKIDILQRNMQEARQEIEQLREDLQSSQNNEKETNQQLEQTQQDLNKSKETIAQYEENVQMLNELKTELNHSLEEAQEEIKSLRENKDSEAKKLTEEKASEIENLKAEKESEINKVTEEKETELNSVREERDSLRAGLDSHQNEKDQRIKDLEKELENAQAKMQENEQETEKTNTNKSQLDSKIKEQDSLLENAQSNIDSLKKELQEMKRKKSKTQQQLDAANAKLEKRESEFNSYEVVNKAKETELKSLRSSNEYRINELKNLRERLEESQEKCAQLSGQLEAIQKSNQELTEKRDELERNLKTEKQRSEELQSQISDQKAKIQRLQSQVNRLKKSQNGKNSSFSSITDKNVESINNTTSGDKHNDDYYNKDTI